MLTEFDCSVHGKWILAGEHAVIRGGTALVFPLTTHNTALHYQAGIDPLKIQLTGNFADSDPSLFYEFIQAGLQHLPQAPTLTGQLTLSNTIPLRSGMGGSAALSVAITQWFIALNLLSASQLSQFATTLEDFFHGESSGADVAAVQADSPLIFQQHTIQSFMPVWQPHWYLHHSGEQAETRHCIAQVREFVQRDPAQAAVIDQQMQRSVALAQAALQNTASDRVLQLADAINLAANCFSVWGLIDDGLQLQIQQLLVQGALAVKPTGSGGGGYLLSLWPAPVPLALLETYGLLAVGV